jgi:O-antigen/teichoic acid export membrane protein
MRMFLDDKFHAAIVANAGSLVGTTVVTSALGFVYWWLAARQFPPQAVGLAVAAISPMMLLANIGVLGLGTLLMGELPRQRDNAGPLISTALVVAGTVGAVLGVIFAILAPFISTDLKPLGADAGSIVLFALGVCLTAITFVIDQSLIGLLRGGVQLGRNALFAVAKLVLLVPAGLWFASGRGMTIYATWVFGIVISLIALMALMNRKLKIHRPQFGLLRRMGRAAFEHHALNLALQAPILALPIVVTVTLSATAAAFFYTTWMVASLVFFGPYSLTLALYAVGSGDPSLLRHKIRFTLRLAGMIGLAATLFVMLGANQILGLFGTTYAEQGTACLRILILGVWPLIIKDHYVAVSRIEGKVAAATLLVAAGAVMELALATLGAVFGGLVGLTIGWVLALCIEGALAMRTVYRAATPSREQATHQTTETVSL